MSDYPLVTMPLKRKGCRDKLAEGLPWLLAGAILGGGVVCWIGHLVWG